MFAEPASAFGFIRVKVIALSVTDFDRANRFYGGTLQLAPAFEGSEQVGWMLGSTILMLKPGWAHPTLQPNPRITIATRHAPDTQAALQAQGIVIGDEVAIYGDFRVGSFIDSEGNKLWFCSPVESVSDAV